ncbi:hypothetical protein HY224_00555 [Candidatus Uhrbacteria bacterium]|nr:hypothetical protein [Candidatus Uhrbacteria bacterium]
MVYRVGFAVLIPLGLLAATSPAQAQFQLVPPPTGVGVCIQNGFGATPSCDEKGFCVGTPGSDLSVDEERDATMAAKGPVECDYTFCDLAGLLTNAAKIIFGVAGALALMYFLYGTFYMIISAGNPKILEKGKKSMTQAIIGLLIVLLAYQIVGELALIFLRPAGFSIIRGTLKLGSGWETLQQGCKVSAIQEKK